MKIDRLLSITIFLLNNEKANAKLLSEKFEVSIRTIQRDIDTLNMAGIPILTTFGADGGYSILQSFKMNSQIADTDDYMAIITALKGLLTAYENPKIEETLEKILSITNSQKSQSIFLDFGVLQENQKINQNIKLIEHAIIEKKAIIFDYINAENISSHRIVEPIALTYKWYSWYLLGYCRDKKGYRLFKLIRISNLDVTNKSFIVTHQSADELLAKCFVESPRKYVDIKLLCKKEVRMVAEEYLNGIIEDENDDNFIMNLHLPENEQLWVGTILSLGNKAIVLEPEWVKERIFEKAKEILETYSQV